jgi:hypothetical protein
MYIWMKVRNKRVVVMKISGGKLLWIVSSGCRSNSILLFWRVITDYIYQVL